MQVVSWLPRTELPFAAPSRPELLVLPEPPAEPVITRPAVKAAVASLPVIAVGLITEPELAAGIVVTGQADMVAIGRAMLYDPRWPWHAAAALGQTMAAPSPYLRCKPHNVKDLFA